MEFLSQGLLPGEPSEDGPKGRAASAHASHGSLKPDGTTLHKTLQILSDIMAGALYIFFLTNQSLSQGLKDNLLHFLLRGLQFYLRSLSLFIRLQYLLSGVNQGPISSSLSLVTSYTSQSHIRFP